MIFLRRKYLLAAALLLLAFGLRGGLSALVRESSLGHLSLPTLTAEQTNPSDTSLPDLSSAVPSRGLHLDRPRTARLSAGPLTEDASDPLLARDLAARAPPA